VESEVLLPRADATEASGERRQALLDLREGAVARIAFQQADGDPVMGKAQRLDELEIAVQARRRVLDRREDEDEGRRCGRMQGMTLARKTSGMRFVETVHVADPVTRAVARLRIGRAIRARLDVPALP
jgi:hypothetical protein